MTGMVGYDGGDRRDVHPKRTDGKQRRAGRKDEEKGGRFPRHFASGDMRRQGSRGATWKKKGSQLERGWLDQERGHLGDKDTGSTPRDEIGGEGDFLRTASPSSQKSLSRVPHTFRRETTDEPEGGVRQGPNSTLMGKNNTPLSSPHLGQSKKVRFTGSL